MQTTCIIGHFEKSRHFSELTCSVAILHVRLYTMLFHFISRFTQISYYLQHTITFSLFFKAVISVYLTLYRLNHFRVAGGLPSSLISAFTTLHWLRTHPHSTIYQPIKTSSYFLYRSVDSETGCLQVSKLPKLEVTDL